MGPLARHLTPEEIRSFGALNDDGTPLIDPASDKKNVAQGAATTVFCAVSAELEGKGGVYCEDSDIATLEADARKGVRPYAVDELSAERLWEESVRLTGVDVA